MNRYNFKLIEEKWQKFWEKNKPVSKLLTKGKVSEEEGCDCGCGCNEEKEVNWPYETRCSKNSIW